MTTQAAQTESQVTVLARLPAIVIFDGVCNLCAAVVRFIVRHEREPLIGFVPLQSPLGQQLLRELGFDRHDVQSFVLLTPGGAEQKSDAALRIARWLRWPWRAFGIARAVPQPLRDLAYDFIASHRYNWFGRCDACMVPTPALRSRFFEH